jgi:hypothetical protein
MQLDLFTGEVNENIAHVYVRLPRRHANQKITGRIRGPFNAYSQTLPANATFRDLGPGDTVLARAVVTDPCTWSPECPALYRLTLNITLDQSSGAELMVHEFGIRRFAARDKHFYLDGRRWVARGICETSPEQASEPITSFREQAAVCITTAKHAPERLRSAAHEGVVVFVDATGIPRETLPAELQRWAKYPSLFLVLLDKAPPIEKLKSSLPNLLFAQRLFPNQPPEPWADVAWFELQESFPPTSLTYLPIPTIIKRSGRWSSLAEARAACDQLQADLAPLGQFAGYVV